MYFFPHQSTQIYHNDKTKKIVFTNILKCFAMRLEIELRCILFTWIILEMFIQLDWIFDEHFC
jgi:hypothetical protein